MFLPAALVVATLASAQPAPAKFELKDGDRIVWIGNTLVEREQRYGYWETALHAAFPDKQFTLRNLGWSGDTVFGDARAGFDTPAKGFERLVSLTLELKPTVIFVSYGMNESFEGEAGLPKFEKGLEKLLDALKPANARVVLFSPVPFERHPQVIDLSRKNEALVKYTAAIRKAAAARGHAFADLFGAVTQAYASLEKGRRSESRAQQEQMTENGMHLTEDGYRFTVGAFVTSLGLGGSIDFATLDALRQAIVAKNQLFFHRWRPQNETYLFGFRKHEQGKNAKEVAEFDPLVARAEGEVERLRKDLRPK